jgi:junctophilin
MEQNFSEIKPDSTLSDSLNLDTSTGNGMIGNTFAASPFKLPEEDSIRFRGVQQEIPHFGAPPKRTESLYMKVAEPQQNAPKTMASSAMQRKKSLPDVAALPVVTVKQGSQAMTREEISVLSSARRDQIRRQIDESERYRANPILYIFNPHIREWFSRQQLMMVVLFVNVSLAIMFFKLLT